MLPTYDASSITVLPGLAAVRQRPGMYIGSTDEDGLHHLAWEVVQNAVDEALAGYCRNIDVRLAADGSLSVEDDGRGIPVDAHASDGRPACEVVLTTLHAGAKFRPGHYAVAGGLHGVGISCVNALSDQLRLRIARDGGDWEQEFAAGEARGPLLRLGDSGVSGTTVQFHPDPLIFGDTRLDAGRIARHLEEQAFLCPGLSLTLRADGRVSAWRYDTGILGYLDHLCQDRPPVHPEAVRIEGERDGVRIQLAMRWTTAYREEVRAFVNHVPTPQGGTHVDGLSAALTRCLERYAQVHGLSQGEPFAGYDVREGLVAVLTITMAEPAFDGQTKTSLTSRVATGAVDHVVTGALTSWLGGHPAAAAAIIGKALEAYRARAAARRASERARYQRVDEGISKDIYRRQFGIRSKNWHDSARWITDQGLLGAHAALCEVSPDARVLDACCGSGVVGNSFRGRVGHITGLDITPEMAKLAATRLDEVVLGDVYAAPFPDASFDLVCNREVLHLLPQPQRPVAEFFRVLKPGGQLVVGQLVPYSAVDAPWMFRILKKKQPLFFNNFLVEDFAELLLGAGFDDLKMVEYIQTEDIDLWIDTHETPNLQRHQIRSLYHHAPAEVRAAHPFQVSPSGAILDHWRWCVFSVRKPSAG